MGEVIGLSINKKIYYSALIENYKNTREMISNLINKNVIPKLFKDEKLSHLKEFSYTNDWSYYNDTVVTLYFYRDADGDADQINVDLIDFV